MKHRGFLASFACLLLMLLFAIAPSQNVSAPLITTVNVAAAGQIPTQGSYAVVKLAPGQNACFVDTSGTYVGQFNAYVKYLGAPVRAVQPSLISNFLASGTGIGANAQGAWTFSVNGPGDLYVSLDSLVSGTPSLTIGCGPGQPMAPNVSVLNLAPNAAQESGGNLATLAGAVVSTKLKVGKPTPLLGAASGTASGLLVSGAHSMSRLIGQNASTTTLYLMVFDASSLPANGTTPIAQVMVPFGISTAPTENVRQFGEDWVPNSTALFYAWSSTSGTLTVVSSGTGLGLEIYGG